MLNTLVLISLTLFGFSSGAVLGTWAVVRSTSAEAQPRLAEILVVVVVLIGGLISGVQLWGRWMHIPVWLLGSLLVGFFIQLFKPRRSQPHELTQ
jgi:hypothetical protein